MVRGVSSVGLRQETPRYDRRSGVKAFLKVLFAEAGREYVRREEAKTRWCLVYGNPGLRREFWFVCARIRQVGGKWMISGLE